MNYLAARRVPTLAGEQAATRVPTLAGELAAMLAATLAVMLSLVSFPAPAAVDAVDDDRRTITLPAPARRIISLAPHVTELLFAAGAGDRIIGTSRYSDFPAAALDIPRIGDSFAIDAERVLALKPDLIVVWLHGNSEAQLEQIRKLGIPVFSSEPRRLADIGSTLRRFGSLTGTGATAETAARLFERDVAALRERYAGRPPVRVFYQIAERPLLTINREHIIDDVLALCGARNVFSELGVLTPNVTAEAVAARDPEAIVTSADEPGNQTSFGVWKKMTAMHATRKGNFIELRSDLISRQSSRIIEGAKRLCAELDGIRARR